MKCYEYVVHPLNGPDLCDKTVFDDIMPLPFRTPSHRPTNKRRRGPPEEEGSSQSRLFRVGQIQRCSNYGAGGHKKRGCPKLVTRSSAVSKSKGKIIQKQGSKSTKGGTKRLSSQPPPEAHKRKKLTRGSSSQPQPMCNTTGPGSTTVGANNKAHSSTSQPKKQPQTKASSSTQPTPKKASKSTKPTSSSQPIGKKAQFSVTNFGNPRVSL
ncbi:hypothetical protein PIB30_008406 [Stylosanthes scabra]|uniref:Uncharacterized protein n=1 Tax=Stylosanthes scabra TaxID=79078 RepID=A0ABU6V7C9_9FABA|nr:hypothetical protein [Stylosanthes scabra]